jgi:hypothetical protein
MIVTQLRTYLADSTESDLYVNGKRYGRTLEDVGRPEWVKVQGQTCIPEGAYDAKVTYSPKFKKRLIQLSNRADGSVQASISFTGIRVHGGSSVGHTEGCILLNGYEPLQAQIEEAAAAGESALWVISSRR